MINLIKPIVEEADTYFGMVKISFETDRLNTESYNKLKTIREWLSYTGVDHKFFWQNTGSYLPTALYMNPDDAVIFKLKFNI